MIDKIRWGIIIVIVAIGAVGGIYNSIFTQTIEAGILTFAAVVFIGFLFIVVPLFAVTIARDEHDTTGKLLGVLLQQIRKHPGIGLWPTGIAAVLFFSLGIVWGVALYQAPTLETIRLMQNSFWYGVISFLVMFLGLTLLFLSRITSKPSLSSSLANHITPELIAQNPQAAIEYSFTFLEDYLRNRIGAGPELTGERLAVEAFEPQNGKLTYGAMDNEDRGVRNLLAGAFATFRNPRKHRIIKDDKHTVFAIVTFVDLLIQLVDKSKDRTITL